LGVTELDGVNHGFFFHFPGAGLDHHDAIRRGHDDDAQQAVAHFGVGGFDDETALEHAHAYGAEPAVTLTVSAGARGGSAVAVGLVGQVAALACEPSAACELNSYCMLHGLFPSGQPSPLFSILSDRTRKDGAPARFAAFLQSTLV